MTNYTTMLEALRAASSAIHGENLETDFDGTDEQAIAHYLTMLNVSLSQDGTAFVIWSKTPSDYGAFMCTIGAPDDYDTMVKPTAEELPDSVFTSRLNIEAVRDNDLEYCMAAGISEAIDDFKRGAIWGREETKRELKNFVAVRPFVSASLILEHFNITE